MDARGAPLKLETIAIDTKDRAEDRRGGVFFSGTRHDLEHLVTTHLFVICPNHSSSAFVRGALATSRRTWNLTREGQNVFGYRGPRRHENDGRLTGSARIWAARKRWLDIYQDPAAYDWPRNRKAWYFSSYARDPRATVFVEKTPSHLLVVGDLARSFCNARFLFVVRNPYAMCEGICRRLRFLGRSPSFPRPALEGERLETVAARHVVACLGFQRRNVETFGAYGRFFTYETMCAEPERVAHEIRTLVPALDDLNLRRKLNVKGRYNEMLTDMNARQIAHLDAGQIAAMNVVFRPSRAVLDHFGYELMDANR